MDQTINTMSNKRIAYVQANWHREIVEQARLSFIKECANHGFDEACIDSFDVPGSLEIPLAVQATGENRSTRDHRRCRAHRRWWYLPPRLCRRYRA